MNTKIFNASVILSLSILGFLWTSPVQADTTYSGRAYAVFVNTFVTQPLYISDTGELPSSGGFRSDSLLSTRGSPVESLLLAEVLVASTSGSSGAAHSSASLAEVVVLPGNPAQVTASLIRAETKATCDGVQGSTEIVELTFGGQTIEVTGAPNQIVTIPGIATLVINEQTMTSSGSYREITVNAVHLTVPGIAEVILSSAKSDIDCVPPIPPGPCHDFVTGGGMLKDGNSRANFGFNAGFKPNSVTPDVHFNYIDHSTGLKMKAASITVYQASSNTSRHFEGTCEIDGLAGYTYSIDVTDNGEPGRNDLLSISLSNGYSRSGALAGGNIQLHNPCP
jgi:hypothetical protein